jgi:hypothetical protein
MISGPDCFSIWAPEGVVWSEWAKPVVFAHAPVLLTEPALVVPELTLPNLPRPWDQSALVVDLPGAQSVLIGLALAERGYRPVPLYNGTSGPAAVVQMDAIEHALGAGADVLKRCTIAADARPAFLLDSERSTTLGAGVPGRYDNRWIVLPQDAPSGTFLLSQGIREVTLIHHRLDTPQPDLSHVLLRWKEAGLRLRAISLETGAVDEDLSLAVPQGFRRLWYGAIALMGLRRNNVGGFGSTVPEQTQSSGFYG